MEQLTSELLQYHLLTDGELANLAAWRDRIYAAWPTEERPRPSLASAQDKCPVLVKGGRCFLPQGEAPSSHILKFELAYYRHLPPMKPSLRCWPVQLACPWYAVIEWYLGKRAPEAALVAATKPEEALRGAFLHCGWRLLKGDKDGIIAELKIAATTCPKGFVERRAAMADLARLGH